MVGEVVFAELGFETATVREICRRADVNIAAVNYYFGDKEHLYVECLRIAHACADGPQLPLPEWPSGTPPLQKLEAFIDTMATKMVVPARASSLQLLMREFTNPSPPAQQIILEYIGPKAHYLRAILAELLPGIDERRLLMTGFSIIGQVLFYRQNRSVVELIFGKEQVGALDAHAVVEHVTRFTLTALGFQTPNPTAATSTSDPAVTA